MLPAAAPERLIPTLEEFRRHDFRWYFTLAIAVADHEPMDLSFVRCPTTLVAGRYDIVTSRHAMAVTAQQIPHARLVVLDGSHFLPLERPDELTVLLRELATQAF
jgi:pimeloyl-ACP methyl ester carboxylesterase